MTEVTFEDPDVEVYDVIQMRATIRNMREQAVLSVREVRDSFHEVWPFVSGLIEQGVFRSGLMISVDLAPLNKRAMFDSYVWAAITLLLFSAGEIIGHSEQGAGVLSVLLTCLLSQCCALMLLPYVFYRRVEQTGGDNKRFPLLILSFLIGLATGFTMHGHRMDYSTPPAFCTALVVALVTSLLCAEELSRPMYLSCVLGSALWFTLLTSLLIGHTLNINFALQQLLTLAVTAFNVQMTIFAASAGTSEEAVKSTLSWVLATQLLDYFVVYCFTETQQDHQ